MTVEDSPSNRPSVATPLSTALPEPSVPKSLGSAGARWVPGVKKVPVADTDGQDGGQADAGQIRLVDRRAGCRAARDAGQLGQSDGDGLSRASERQGRCDDQDFVSRFHGEAPEQLWTAQLGAWAVPGPPPSLVKWLTRHCFFIPYEISYAHFGKK
ncbi:MAG: hypothetical protein HY020_16355 [Burkholderiales bacterium]|nr:hypothetical protein [Burkholderiales bacterium]